MSVREGRGLRNGKERTRDILESYKEGVIEAKIMGGDSREGKDRGRKNRREC